MLLLSELHRRSALSSRGHVCDTEHEIQGEDILGCLLLPLPSVCPDAFIENRRISPFQPLSFVSCSESVPLSCHLKKCFTFPTSLGLTGRLEGMGVAYDVFSHIKGSSDLKLNISLLPPLKTTAVW